MKRLFTDSRKHFWICAFIVAVLDQLTKFLFFNVISFDEPWKIVPDIFHIVRRTNPAAAFSLGPENPLFYIVITLVGMGVLIWLLTDLPPDRLLAILGLGAVAGGAVGNLIDRIYMGEVRDFIEVFYWPGRPPWPAFNVADAAICVGVAIVLVESFRHTKHENLAG